MILCFHFRSNISVLEEVTLCLNLEKLRPSYKLIVTVACIKAIRTLQKFGHLPNNPAVFRSYAAYGNFVGKSPTAAHIQFTRNSEKGQKNNQFSRYVWFFRVQSDVRMSALEALVDFTRLDGKWPDLEFLLDLMTHDADPGIRRAVVRMLCENPPFQRGSSSHGRHRLDKEDLVHKLWLTFK